jgi:hypothetical protein
MYNGPEFGDLLIANSHSTRNGEQAVNEGMVDFDHHAALLVSQCEKPTARSAAADLFVTAVDCW